MKDFSIVATLYTIGGFNVINHTPLGEGGDRGPIMGYTTSAPNVSIVVACHFWGSYTTNN